jgi:hypothetical protein
MKSRPVQPEPDTAGPDAKGVVRRRIRPAEDSKDRTRVSGAEMSVPTHLGKELITATPPQEADTILASGVAVQPQTWPRRPTLLDVRAFGG